MEMLINNDFTRWVESVLIDLLEVLKVDSSLLSLFMCLLLVVLAGLVLILVGTLMITSITQKNKVKKLSRTVQSQPVVTTITDGSGKKIKIKKVSGVNHRRR